MMLGMGEQPRAKHPPPSPMRPCSGHFQALLPPGTPSSEPRMPQGCLHPKICLDWTLFNHSPCWDPATLLGGAMCNLHTAKAKGVERNGCVPSWQRSALSPFLLRLT